MNAKRVYFEEVADRWDGMVDLNGLQARLRLVLDDIQIGTDERILDLGCGTGNLTALLTERLSHTGCVVAVDFSGRMLSRARTKVKDPRVSWVVADAHTLPLADASVDRVFCFSAWPHFDDPDRVAEGIARVLRPGGRLHILHTASRLEVNEIHLHAGRPLERDLLVPVEETSAMLREGGFREMKVWEDDRTYGIEIARA